MANSKLIFTPYPASERHKSNVLAYLQQQGRIPVIVNDVYLPHFNRPERIQIWYGGSGSGKSDAKATQLLLKCLTAKYCRVLFLRKFREQVKDSQYQLFKDLIGRYHLQDYFRALDASLDVRCLVNGNMLLSGGLDDVDKLKSIPDVTDIWIEEPIDKKGNISSADFRELNRRLRCPKALNHIHLTFNPISKESWIHTYFFKSNEYQAFNLRTTYLDNHFSPPETHSQFETLKRFDPEEYKVYALGEWGSLKQGLVFPEYEIVQDFPPDCRKWGYGLDWGFYPDPCALIRCGIKDGVLYLDEVFYLQNSTSATRDKIMREAGVSRAVKIMADRNPEAISEMKQKGWYNIEGATKGPGSVKAGLNVMHNFKICITARSKNLKAEMDNYQWAIDRHTEKPTGEPMDAFNHAIDAARYWVSDTVMVKKGVSFA
jgi:phage terminase large subunit